MTGDLTQSSTPDLATPSKARRSTRVFEPVRLKILGESRIGTPQLELTSALAVNCHGCVFLSRHEHRKDSWMTLEVSNQQSGTKSPPVRAQVRFVRLPGNPRELYCVGVELETPANVWGFERVPEDWLPYSDSACVAAGAAQAAGPVPEIQTATPDQGKRIPPDFSEFFVPALAWSMPEPAPSQPSPGKSENAATPPDEMIRAWEKKLREAAEQAVASAVAAHVNAALKQVVKAIEIANQESILRIAAGAGYGDTLLIPPHLGFLNRLNGELANAGERLFEWTTALFTRTQTVAQGLRIENGTPEIQPAPAEVGAVSKKLVSGQVNVRAGGDARYGIKIDTSKMLRLVVTGWFRASGGSKNDIALVLATEYEFENLIHGNEARVLFATNGIKAIEFRVPITESGSYILALNNRFSIFMPRAFTANVDLRYSTPQPSSPATDAPTGQTPRVGREKGPF